MNPCSEADLPEQLRRFLELRNRLILPDGAVPAAVLVPLFVRDGRYHALFTRRTDHLQHHGGENSFPGGVLEPEEGAVEGALREAWEETGIHPDDVAVLGLLDDIHSIHNYRVTPVVGLIPADYPYRVNAGEIERLIEPPLDHFARPGAVRREQRIWQGDVFDVSHYDYLGDDIWGMTAAVLEQLLEFTAEVTR